MDMVL